MKDKTASKIGLEELKTYPRYECWHCGCKEFGLCKLNIQDGIFPDIICIKCGSIVLK